MKPTQGWKMTSLFTLLLLPGIITRAQDNLPGDYADLDLFDTRQPGFFDEVRLINRDGKSQIHLVGRKGGQEAFISVLPGQFARKEGEATGFYQNQAPWFKANYAENQLSGTWQSWYPNGNRCDSGYLKNNIPDGPWRGWYPNGQLRFDAHFNIVSYTETREVMKTMMDRNFQSKTVAGRFGDGNLAFYKGVYQDMLNAITPSPITGAASLLPLFERLGFNNDHGDSQYIPPFSQGVLDGMFISYFPNGSIADSGFYQEGQRIGEWMERQVQPELTGRGYYRKGVKTGDWKYYDSQGALRYIDRYSRQGRLRGRSTTK